MKSKTDRFGVLATKEKVQEDLPLDCLTSDKIPWDLLTLLAEAKAKRNHNLLIRCLYERA